MTQFNLLPSIKLEYLKAERDRKLVISISILVTIIAIIIASTLFTLTIIQKSQINSLAADIQQQGSLLSGQKDLNDILTIQNQISTLTTLHEQEPAVANLATYLNQLIPVQANISNLNIDFTTDSMIITGNADSLATVNQLIDSLEFATYKVKGTLGSKSAFSQVVLTDFGVTPQGASYTINFNFDPTLFNNTETVTLNVPSKVTTRSQLDQPTILFKPNIINKTKAN